MIRNRTKRNDTNLLIDDQQDDPNLLIDDQQDDPSRANWRRHTVAALLFLLIVASCTTSYFMELHEHFIHFKTQSKLPAPSKGVRYSNLNPRPLLHMPVTGLVSYVDWLAKMRHDRIKQAFDRSHVHKFSDRSDDKQASYRSDDKQASDRSHVHKFSDRSDDQLASYRSDDKQAFERSDDKQTFDLTDDNKGIGRSDAKHASEL